MENGSNGKSQLAKIFRKLIGEDNITSIPLQDFEKQFGAHQIAGKLLNLVPELPAKKVNDVSTWKALSTSDSIQVDVKYKDAVTVKSYAKHVFLTNNIIQTSDTSNGFWRRINILLFEQTFNPASSTFDINEFLKQDNLDYLGTRGIQAYMKLLHSNNFQFANTAESLEILEGYKNVSDTIIGFLTDEESQDLYGRDIKTTIMWANYKAYCADNRLIPLRKQQFYAELQNDYNFIKKKVNGYPHFFKAYNDLETASI